MKPGMLRWLTAERPEAGATETWNAVNIHHMIAVSEQLGRQVIARNVSFRKALEA
jgi:hypothetical protein